MNRLVFFWAALLLFSAPLIRGGNRQVAIAALLLLGLALAATLVARGLTAHKESVSVPESIALGLLITSPLWLGLVQFWSLPVHAWQHLAGREPYAAMGDVRSSLALVPSAAWGSVATAVPIAAMFWAGLVAAPRHAERLLWILLVAAAVQLIVALVQLVQGPASMLRFASAYSTGVIGTFNNRNHLAGFFATLIPVWFLLLTRSNVSSSDQASLMPSMGRPLLLFFGFSLVVLILATQSRGGLTAAVVALSASVLLLAARALNQLSLMRKLGLLTALGTFGLAAVMSVGLDKASERFEQGKLRTDADIRHAYSESALEGARAFSPWGSGLGSFEGTFPRFQAIDSLGYVDYAHNDYAQLWMELGVVGIGLAVIVGLLVLAQGWRLWRTRESATSGHILSCYAGVGVAAMSLHSAVEFNMHVPALALTAAFLLGVFLRPIEGEGRRGRARRTASPR